MLRKLAASAAFCSILATGALAQLPVKSCNIGDVNTNYSCVIEEVMDADGFQVNINNYNTGTGTSNGTAYVIESSDAYPYFANDPYLTDGGWNLLADNVYANGHFRYICHFGIGRTCPSQIKVLPVTVTNKQMRVNIYRLNN